MKNRINRQPSWTVFVLKIHLRHARVDQAHLCPAVSNLPLEYA